GEGSAGGCGRSGGAPGLGEVGFSGCGVGGAGFVGPAFGTRSFSIVSIVILRDVMQSCPSQRDALIAPAGLRTGKVAFSIAEVPTPESKSWAESGTGASGIALALSGGPAQ